MSRGSRPGPSPPISIAVGARRSTSNSERPPRGTVAMMRQPCVRASAMAAAASAATPIGRRSALPIDPRSAFQPNGSAQAPAAITLVAPAGLGDADDRAEVAGILHVAGDDARAAPARRSSRAVLGSGPAGDGDDGAGRSHGADRCHHRAAVATTTSTPVALAARPSACGSRRRSIAVETTAACSIGRPAASASATR